MVEVEYRTTMGVQGVSGDLTRGRAWVEPDGGVMERQGAGAAVPFLVGDRAMITRTPLFDLPVRRRGGLTEAILRCKVR